MSIEQAERALAELEAKETVTDEDLEAFIEQLPTDPEVARFVDAALPFPWSEVVGYVGPSERQSGYWRTKADQSEPRSAAEAAYRERFREAAAETRGVKGTVERDGKAVPLSAAALADHTAGQRFSAARARATGQKALRRLRDVLGV